MSLISVRIYRAASGGVPCSPSAVELDPDALLATLPISIQSDKPLNKERAKKAVALAVPKTGKPWVMWRRSDGWLSSIEYSGGKAWALVSNAAGA
jgi:hypothetical protein